MVKNPPANAGDVRDVGLIPGSGGSPGGGHDNPLQYSCLENSMARGACQATEKCSKSFTDILGKHIDVQNYTNINKT